MNARSIVCLCLYLSASGIAFFPAHAEEAPDSKHGFHFAGGEEIFIMANNEAANGIRQLVTTEGNISILAGGTVNILGKSLQEATDAANALTQQITGVKSPHVSIAIQSLGAHQVYVQGAVTSPKAVLLPPDRDMPLAAALAEAGGATEDADISHIKLFRAQNLKSGKPVIVDGASFGNSEVDALGPVVQTGDVIIVPRSETFMISGEVNKPGIYSRKDTRVMSGLSVRLTHILAAAGGTKPSANKRLVKVYRTDEKGQTTTLEVNLEPIFEKGDRSGDVVLLDGDQVFVPATEGVMLIGRVRSPGVYYNTNVPLTVSRIIALAGGFDSSAKRSAVMVTKKGQPGATKVDMKAVIEEGHVDQDVLLQPGDIVFVGESSL